MSLVWAFCISLYIIFNDFCIKCFATKKIQKWKKEAKFLLLHCKNKLKIQTQILKLKYVIALGDIL